MSIPYSAEKGDLSDPAKRAVWFPAGRPKSDAALCAELSRQACCGVQPRYVGCCDIITYVPPKNWGYEHLGEPYYMTFARESKLNPPQTDSDDHRTQAEKEYIEKSPGRSEMCPGLRSPIRRRATMSGPATAATPQHGPRQENSLQRDEEF